MDEEQINELSQLAEEIANEGFDNISSETESINAVVDTFISAATNPESVVTTDTVDGVTPEVVEEEERDFIPPNITTTITEESTSRFSSAEWFSKISRQDVTLAGLGGIGSWAALLLGRCRPESLSIYDFDTVESVNMAGQLYGTQDLGSYKTHTIIGNLRNYCNYFSINQYTGRYTEESRATNIMICGFDNMEARKIFYNRWKARSMQSFTPESCLFIDARLNAEEWQIFAIRGTDTYRMKEYEDKWLFNDDEVEEALCSYKQTSFCASMIASYIVNIFVNFVANMCEPIIDRDVPFLTEYDAKTMYLKTVQ